MVHPDSESEPMLPEDASDESEALETAGGNCCSRLSRWFLVEPVLILYIFGVFPIQTISQKYILHQITAQSLDFLDGQNISFHENTTNTDPCHSNKSDPIYQFQEYVQSKSSQFVLYESIIYGIPAIFVTIILGAGSDVFGRRIAILPPLVGALFGSSIVTFVICTEASIYWLFLGDAALGCCGSFYCLLMGCFAYVADRTPPERRMIRITFIELTMLIPGVISPIVLGKVTTSFGYMVPLVFIVATAAVNLIYVLIFLSNENRLKTEPHEEESMTKCPQMPSQSGFVSLPSLLWTQLRSVMALFVEKSGFSAEHWRRLKLNLLIAAFFIISVANWDSSNSTLFMMNRPLCWDVDNIGLFAGVGFAVSSVGAMIVTPLFKRCGMSDYVIAILAGLACTATNAYITFVQTTMMMFLSLSLSMIAILIKPSLRSLMSSHVNNDQQGAIFGAIGCVEVTCDLIGTVLFNSVYSATLFISTGFVFIVMAAFYAAGSAIVCLYIVLVRLDAHKESSHSVPINESLLDDAEPDRLDNSLHSHQIN